jgi:hypothetical protein
MCPTIIPATASKAQRNDFVCGKDECKVLTKGFRSVEDIRGQYCSFPTIESNRHNTDLYMKTKHQELEGQEVAEDTWIVQSRGQSKSIWQLGQQEKEVARCEYEGKEQTDSSLDVRVLRAHGNFTLH